MSGLKDRWLKAINDLSCMKVDLESQTIEIALPDETMKEILDAEILVFNMRFSSKGVTLLPSIDDMDMLYRRYNLHTGNQKYDGGTVLVRFDDTFVRWTERCSGNEVEDETTGSLYTFGSVVHHIAPWNDLKSASLTEYEAAQGRKRS